MDDDEAASELERRVTIEIRDTRLGSMAVVADKSAEAGIRPTTAAESIALAELPKIVSKLDPAKNNDGRQIVDVIVDKMGNCEIEWNDSAKRTVC